MERRTHATTMIETLALAFRHMPVAMAIWTPGGELMDANPAYAQLFGYEHEEFVAQGSTRFIHPDEPWHDPEQWPRKTNRSGQYR